MSSFEYYDLFLKSQNDGEYHMFTFDLKDIYNYLKEVELIINQKIVLDQCLVEN